MRTKFWVLTILALLLSLAGGSVHLYWQTKRAEPSYAGAVQLSGLTRPVTVAYGPHAVPSIQAGSLRDLLFAQGFVLASERMWQMDLMRRLARGMLAEVLGPDALPADRFFRTLGLGRAAERNLATLDPVFQGYLSAYAQGVNAYLKQAGAHLPIEYRLAGFRPGPWTPSDSLAIAEYMAYLLSFNMREELVYLRLAARLGPQRVLELFPTDEGIPAPEYARELPDYALRSEEVFEQIETLTARWGLPTPGGASNSWALAGSRTRSGLPLLANDPHLSPTMPGIWYELEMRAPGYHVTGIALPGLPLVLIGHNDHLAWGLTTAMADTQDLFVERVNEAGTAVERGQGRWEIIETFTEKIHVKNRQDPENLTVRRTSNGVVINGILGGQTGTPMDLVQADTPHLIALRWNIELPDQALEGLYRLNTATTIGQARNAARQLAHASQNLVVAHKDGSIAWQVSGALPLRKKGLGTFPSPGWREDYGWSGYLPRMQNPGAENPAAGMLLTANNRTISTDHRVHVTRSWMAPYRASRIRELLQGTEQLSANDLAQMQLDRENVQAQRFLASLRQVAPELQQIDPQAWAIAKDQLLDWDSRAEPDSRSAALFVLLRQALFTEIYGDELGQDLEALMSIAVVSYNALEETMYRGESSFWDDVRTPEAEGPARIWGRAIRSAWSALERRQGNPVRARLDRLRLLVFPHAFHGIPVLGRLFDVGPLGAGGDNHTLNVTKTLPMVPESPLFIPSYRVVFTPGDWTGTRGTQTLGQSGHRLSPYRTDQLADWQAGRTHRWAWGGPAEEHTLGTLELLPAR